MGKLYINIVVSYLKLCMHFLAIIKNQRRLHVKDHQSNAHSDSSDDCNIDGHVQYAVLLPDAFAVLDLT